MGKIEWPSSVFLPPESWLLFNYTLTLIFKKNPLPVPYQ